MSLNLCEIDKVTYNLKQIEYYKIM